MNVTPTASSDSPPRSEYTDTTGSGYSAPPLSPPSFVPSLTSGLAPLEVDTRLSQAVRASDLGHRALSYYLHEFDQRALYSQLGYANTVHYATTRLGLSRSFAYELMKNGRELDGLPRIDKAFRQGELSWSKTRLITRVAVPETQEQWLDEARSTSCKELGREVSASQKGWLPRKEKKGLPEVTMKISGKVDCVTHEIWETARRKLQDDLGEGVTNGTMFRLFAHAFLAGKLDLLDPSDKEEESGSTPNNESSENRTPKRKTRPANQPRAPYQVLFERCRESGVTLLLTEDGPIQLQPKTAARAENEGLFLRTNRPEPSPPRSSQTQDQTTRPFEEIDRPTPEWMRRKVLARDCGKCRSCSSRYELWVHHIRWRSWGGRTEPDNLVSLCPQCHALVHAGLLRIEGDPRGKLFFRDQWGEPREDPHKTTTRQPNRTPA